MISSRAVRFGAVGLAALLTALAAAACGGRTESGGAGGGAATGGGSTVDPCVGVTCDAPPAASCADATTLRTYGSPGTCSDGSCSYGSFTDTTCQYVCSAGACAGACAPGTRQCSGLTPQTCDTNGQWRSDAACSSANGTASCAGGACNVTCTHGHGNCDADDSNGCEATFSSTSSCGGCGNVCAATEAISATCDGRQCSYSCTPGYVDCNAATVPNLDGCETNTSSDAAHCGNCTTTCPGSTPMCSGGTCVAPPSCAASGEGLTNCGDGSVGTESCCTSLPVTGGVFYRSYDGITYRDADFPAKVSDFRLDKYEITVGRFRQFVVAWNGGWRPADGAGKHTHLNGGSGLSARPNSYLSHEPGWNEGKWNGYLATTNDVWSDASHLSCDPRYQNWTPVAGSNERRPINCATWYEAEAFCIWDGGFLPSGAEWNYAASGGYDHRSYPWSSPFPNGSTTIDCTYANYKSGAGYCVSPPDGATNNVGSESPRGNGKYGQADLGGNVWEWNVDWAGGHIMPCDDCADTTDYQSTRAYRGGSFYADASDLLVSYAGYHFPEHRDASVGARCARTP